MSLTADIETRNRRLLRLLVAVAALLVMGTVVYVSLFGKV